MTPNQVKDGEVKGEEQKEKGKEGEEQEEE